jgi:hypothetical protein
MRVLYPGLERTNYKYNLANFKKSFCRQGKEAKPMTYTPVFSAHRFSKHDKLPFL